MRERLADAGGLKAFSDFIRAERQALNMRIPRRAPDDHPDKVVVRAYRDVERTLNADGGEKLFVELLMKSRALEMMEAYEVVEEPVRAVTETVSPQEEKKKKGGWRFWRR